MEFYISGSIMSVSDPANAHMSNIYVDTDNLVSAFYFAPNWNYPEAYATPHIYMENMTFYASEGITVTRPKWLDYRTSGNITMKDINLTNAYNQASDGDSHFVVNSDPTCAPQDGLLRNVEVHGAKLSLENNQYASKTNLVVFGTGANKGRRNVFNFTDFYADNFHGGIYGSFAIIGTFTEEVYYTNIHFNNYSGFWNMGYFFGWGTPN